MAFLKNFAIVSLIIALFAIFHVQSSSYEFDQYSFAPRANVSFGTLGPSDFLLYSANADRANSTVQQIANVQYVGFNVNVTYIYAMERGANQFANVSIVAGGLSQSNATVRITSVAGRGFNYTVSFYGRNQ